VYATAESTLLRADTASRQRRSNTDKPECAGTMADFFRPIKNPYKIDVLVHMTKSIPVSRARKKKHLLNTNDIAK
jgi:hypothetical protein